MYFPDAHNYLVLPLLRCTYARSRSLYLLGRAGEEGRGEMSPLCRFYLFASLGNKAQQAHQFKPVHMKIIFTHGLH